VIRHYYHLYLDGDAAWEPIAAEYAQAMRAAGFGVPPAVGLVGADREPAKRWLAANMPGWSLAAEADAGYEQVTLAALQRDLPAMAGGDQVLYAHSKGAWRNMPAEDQWRRSMLWHVLFGWRECAGLLETHQAAGCHWMGDHFAGNFWWATAGYLRTLPPVTGTTEAERGQAETWIGLGRPAVADLLPGFASPELTAAGALNASARLPARLVSRRRVWPAAG
jgi:hypothetical protein